MRKWFGQPEYYYCEPVEMYVVHGWSRQDDRGRGFGAVVELAHFAEEEHAREFIWMLENPRAYEAAQATLHACMLAIDNCQFPVGAMATKVALGTAIAKAREGGIS